MLKLEPGMNLSLLKRLIATVILAVSRQKLYR